MLKVLFVPFFKIKIDLRGTISCDCSNMDMYIELENAIQNEIDLMVDNQDDSETQTLTDVIKINTRLRL